MSFDLQTVKAAFFDKKAVKDKLDPAVRKALSKMGGYVRRVARNSLKYSSGSSAAGSPPHVHTTNNFTRLKKGNHGKITQQSVSPYRELIFYSYDPATKSVVAGPVIWAASKGGGARVLKTIEKGGMDRQGHSHRPRPTMGLALTKSLPAFPENFKSLIR